MHYKHQLSVSLVSLTHLFHYGRQIMMLFGIITEKYKNYSRYNIPI